MKINYFSFATATLLLCGIISPFKAQDSSMAKQRKNIIRVNIVNPVLFGETSYLLGYERVVGKHQSMSINVGRLDFGKFFFSGFKGINNTYLQINNNYDDKGIHTSLDYRFYLKKENKFNAPRGIYLAPYLSYNYFQRVTSWYASSPVFSGDFTTTFTMKMATVGGEMGYQFVLWKRLALDFILIGPGISNYRFSGKFSTTLDSELQGQVLETLYQKLEESLIGLGWVLDGDQFIKSGSTNTMALGFRYMIHIGFNF